ncbi:MAG: isoprenylcysteine carboxylmethyltransferase family protein [Anaerolineae bacterium]|nr:MAG: isoprenylcysteine carboxylmethyltransferase family protein [Anaerolineae bacterium]
MSLNTIERWLGWAGAAAMASFLGIALLGIARGLFRPRGRATGLARQVLRPTTYLFIGVGFFGLCILLWRPLPVSLSALVRSVALALGTLLYFPGLSLYLWAWQTLGEMYDVSSSLGAQLYADHRLITHGPFALIRHPMYLGLILAAAGGLLIYRTWTFVFVSISFLGLVLRARREEQALAAEFGQTWQAYCQRVPGWIPRLPKPR